MTLTKTICLAGPDVFKPDFAVIRDRLKTWCRASGASPLPYRTTTRWLNVVPDSHISRLRSIQIKN
ncbi:MAG: hypothetical protein ACOH2K_18225 [Burkholderiaceae bacterium]